MPLAADAERWVRTLALSPHPEGGWFRETYRSAERLPRHALPGRFTGDRVLATSILYLLGAGERSCFHRLRADETWWHHGGAPMHLHLLASGGVRRVEVGPDSPQALVPHGTWFAAEPAGSRPEVGSVPAGTRQGAAFSLVGCGTSPGFEYEDFELADRAALLAEFPSERELVTRFTRAPGEPEWR